MIVRRTALTFGLALLSGGAGTPAACASKAWQTLPPTPKLPPLGTTAYVETAGAKLFVAEIGQGPPLILLHGGLANADYWGNQIPSLAQHHRVFALDTRGHGRSTMSSQKLSYQLFADDVRAVMQARSLTNAAVAGWSDGAITALHLASREPGRITRLFCFGANTTPAGARPAGDRSPVFAQYLRRVPDEYRRLSSTPEQFDRLRAAMGALWRHGSDLPRSRLAAIRAATCIADGEHDEIIPAGETAGIARAIPGASLIMLPCVSHFAMLQAPVQFAGAVSAAIDG